MKISKSLPPPDNWKDFERLCKKLWGEIWDCPEITMNGRNGQDQSGIDISGIPKGENSYYGIQCKGKDLYTQSQLKENEVIEEIEKAKSFEPALKKLYFTTTAVKNAKIEAFFRKKNLEHIKQNLFEVHLYSWEDIVDLIVENKHTYDYYLNSKSFKTRHSVNLTFKNGETELIARPKFQRTVKVGRSRRKEMEIKAAKTMPFWTKSQENLWINDGILDLSHMPPTPTTKFNRSLFDSTLVVNNDGSEPLEDWKLFVILPKEIIEYKTENKINKHSVFSSLASTKRRDTFYKKENHSLIIDPIKKILVGDDSFMTDKFFLKTTPDNATVEMYWKLVSRNYKTEGVLKINIQPEWEMNIIKVDDDSPKLLDEEKRVTIEDFIESVDD